MASIVASGGKVSHDFWLYLLLYIDYADDSMDNERGGVVSGKQQALAQSSRHAECLFRAEGGWRNAE